MKYVEFIKKRQDEFNALPVKYAFNKEQFKKIMNEWGLTENDTDKIYKIGNTGGFYLKKCSPEFRAWFEANSDDKLDKLMQDENFAVEAYYYEMCNHEYGINMDGDWDVLQCFGKESLSELDEKQLTYYAKAKEKYYNDALDNEWL